MARLFNKAPNFCLSCLTNDTLPATCVYQCLCLCKLWAFVAAFPQLTHTVFVGLCSSFALQHHDHHLDLHGPGVWSGHLSGHHHLQETARLHFTTLPISAVCGTISYTTLTTMPLCVVSFDQISRVRCISLSCCHLKMWEKILFKPVFEKYH